MKIVDMHGVEQDLEWLQKNYGQVEWTDTTRHELVKLYEVDGPTTQVISILRKDGTGLPFVNVRFSWENGAKFDEGYTNQEGNAGFGMGAGAYYELPKQGPHQVSYKGVNVRGLGWIRGLGWKWMSNHQHLNVVIQEVDNEPTPSPNTEALLMEVLDRLDWIIEHLVHQKQK